MITEAQLELLRDKYVLWERSSRTGPMDLRDYNARCAEALKEALCIVAEDAAATATASPARREREGSREAINPEGQGSGVAVPGFPRGITRGELADIQFGRLPPPPTEGVGQQEGGSSISSSGGTRARATPPAKSDSGKGH